MTGCKYEVRFTKYEVRKSTGYDLGAGGRNKNEVWKSGVDAAWGLERIKRGMEGMAFIFCF